jgi:hypothetical protein
LCPAPEIIATCGWLDGEVEGIVCSKEIPTFVFQSLKPSTLICPETE